jgi:DNA-binding transcriptional ArsR family regulator
MIEALPPSRDIAAIDIGSNSVRLVLYRLEGRAIWTVFNEKVLAGLGRDLATTGRLSPDGVTLAMTALRRFAAVLEGVRPERTLIAATAAVREAADGPEFCERVAAETGLRIRVLSGEEEAKYAAMGVLAGAPDAHGVYRVAELADVSQPTVSHHLKVLRDAGVVTAERRGTWVWYSVDGSMRPAVTALLESFAPVASARSAATARPSYIYVCRHHTSRLRAPRHRHAFSRRTRRPHQLQRRPADLGVLRHQHLRRASDARQAAEGRLRATR